MFATVDEVKAITDYDVDYTLASRASFIIEAYVGLTEQEVLDMPFSDQEICRKASAFQAAYMKNNPMIPFEQAAVASTGTGQMITTFKSNDFTAPWIAPLAVLACRRLSWFRSKSVATAPVPARVVKAWNWETT